MLFFLIGTSMSQNVTTTTQVPITTTIATTNNTTTTTTTTAATVNPSAMCTAFGAVGLVPVPNDLTCKQ